MLHFDTDYMEGALPQVMQALLQTNLEQTIGYGADSYSATAKDLIRAACQAPNALVQFLIGGTQTNATVIDALLRRHQGVLCPETAHINVHESGAVEHSGHKVLTLPSHAGKLCPKEVENYLVNFYADDTYEHMVAPGLLYLTQPTEYGTLYTLSELEELRALCDRFRMPLYVDGARLAYALASPQNNVSLPDLARLSHAFYLGGTKCGLLFGEAVVAANPQTLPHFFPLVKQHGALLAKGRLQGVQFATLFQDNLYVTAARKAVTLALRIKEAFVAQGYEMAIDSPTNQQFVTLPNAVMDFLAQEATFEVWGTRGATHTTVRFVTSWATKEEDVDALIEMVKRSAETTCAI